jgi:hypothetical protein
VQSQQLPTKSQVFEDEVLAGTESADYPAEEMSERHDHGKNFSGKDRIKLCAKSFISQVYDLLARHRSFRANPTEPVARRLLEVFVVPKQVAEYLAINPNCLGMCSPFQLGILVATPDFLEAVKIKVR